jgi:DNA ligase D-like protein (predicted ligase)
MVIEEFEKKEPMLAKLGSLKDLKKKAYIYEPFYGGTRALLYKKDDHIRLLNRKGMWIEFRYPELLEISRHIKARTAIIDGEIVVLDAKGNASYAGLEAREHAAAALEIENLSKEKPATFMAFDIIMKGNRWLNDRPLFERKKALEEAVQGNSIIRPSPWTKDGTALFADVKKRKLEGVIAKSVNARYQFGVRSDALLKIKSRKTIDCVVVGWKEGKSGFGALALGIYKELHLFYMGTVDSFSEEFVKAWSPRLAALKQKKPPVRNPPEGWQKDMHWLKPSLVCEVEYEDITRKLEIVKPSFVRMRSDKDPQSCTLTEQVKLK